MIGIAPLDDPAALPAAYLRAAPPPPEAPPLAGDTTAEVAIVGGGFSGLSAALHLAERGVSVVLLEARGLATGGSGRAFGQVVPYAKHGEPHILRHFGDAAGTRIIDALGQGPAVVWDLIDRHGIACDDCRSGLIFAAHTGASEAGLRDRAAFWQARGAPVEMLDAARCEELIGSRRYATALIDRRGGHINPLAYALGLAQAARRAGARLHAQSRVTSLAPDGDGWRLRTDAGSVRAARIVICAGAYADDLWPGLRQSVIPIRAHQLVTAPLSANLRATILPGGQSLTDTRRLYSGIRLLPDGRLHLSVDGEGFGRNGVTYADKAAQRARGLFPQLGEIAFEEAWTGWVDMSADQYPHLHRLAGNAWAVIGLSGRGIAFGTLLGREVARRLVDGDKAETFMPVTPLKRIAVRPFAAPLVGALMSWYRVLDRRELGGAG
jgi:glycine/D-amino acid oxidase-like deaminating enzyme